MSFEDLERRFGLLETRLLTNINSLEEKFLSFTELISNEKKIILQNKTRSKMNTVIL